jgi:murein DD-endopeptidase MepM/ murein hydrolase activator NlpD
MTPFMEGPDVEAVQRALGVEVDGVYGPITAAAVRAWQWKPGGYPKSQLSDRLGVKGQAWLLGTLPIPAGYTRRADLRVPFAELEPVRPLETPLTPVSEFGVPDAEGAPNAAGTAKFHAAKDWFAPGGSLVRSPVAGPIVEVKESRGDTGQIFGGVVKVQSAADGKVWVFRHVDPRGVAVGNQVGTGEVIATVTAWRDGPSHAHIELWKTLAGGYVFENMLDPLQFLR